MNTKLTKKSMMSPLLKLGFYFSLILILFFIADVCVANVVDPAFARERLTLGKVALNIVNSMRNLAKLITAASYVAGISFAMMGMLKFKGHKDNPTQVPLSQPLVLLAISAGLVYLPTLISTGGQTLWKESQISGSTTGHGLEGIMSRLKF